MKWAFHEHLLLPCSEGGHAETPRLQNRTSTSVRVFGNPPPLAESGRRPLPGPAECGQVAPGGRGERRAECRPARGRPERERRSRLPREPAPYGAEPRSPTG